MAGTRTTSRARATGKVRPKTQASAAGRARRHLRVRKKVTGSAARPRLVVNLTSRSGRPNVATAGAISATLVVHDTIAPRPSSTIDTAVMRRNASRPPNARCTEPISMTGLPPENVAVRPPRKISTQSQCGIDGNAPR